MMEKNFDRRNPKSEEKRPRRGEKEDEGSSKRLKKSGSSSSERMSGRDEKFKSKIVCLFDLKDDQVEEGDIIAVLGVYGPIAYVTLEPDRSRVLVEFEFMECAEKCVKSVEKSDGIIIGKTKFLARYSHHATLSRGDLETATPRNILLFTITNATFPITTQTIYAICKPQDSLKKIKFLPTSGDKLRVLVELDGVSVAQNLKLDINGADIFPRCCSLKIEYSSVPCFTADGDPKLEWDSSHFPEGPMQSMVQPKIETFSAIPAVDDGALKKAVQSVQMAFLAMMDDERSKVMDKDIGTCTSVIALCGVNKEFMNCDKVFNILCCYGNVNKVRFVLNSNVCLVEMGSPDQVQNALAYLGGGLKSKEVHILFQKSLKWNLRDESNPVPLPDGTMSVKNYEGSEMNRFSVRRYVKGGKNGFPSDNLYVTNIPPVRMNLADIQQTFVFAGAEAPVETIFFNLDPNRNAGHGIARFATIEDAVDALIKCNNIVIHDHAGAPYVMRLSFSRSAIKKPNRGPGMH